MALDFWRCVEETQPVAEKILPTIRRARVPVDRPSSGRDARSTRFDADTR
jgi:hypothetical protein